MRQMKSSMLVAVAIVLLGLGCGGGSLPEQVGEACSDISEAFCARALSCGLITATEELRCTNQLHAACCANDGTCNNPVDSTITESDWDGCLSAIDTELCTDVEMGNLPAACLSL